MEDDTRMVEAGAAPLTIDVTYHSTNDWGYTTTLGRRIDVAALGHAARWVYAKMLRLSKPVSDHNPFRIKFQLTK